MKTFKPLVIVTLLYLTACNSHAGNYDKYFENKTMRVDYFHTGKATEENFAIDRVLSDGIWSGSKTVLLDDLKFGLYFFEVFDQQSSTLIYSRGYASIFGEWQTTPEAGTQWGTFNESVRFPWPKSAVKLVISKRDAKMQFAPIFETVIDPAARSVNKADLVQNWKIYNYIDNGDVNRKVDIVILGDGYTIAEMDKFRKDVARLTEELFKVEPYKSRRKDFNVRAIETPSPVSGVSRPHAGIFKRSILSVHYSSFDSERYALTYDNRTVRDIASAVPYDYMYILINERMYGGGGIYNLYASVASDNKFSDYIFVHEFGHCFAGLADEYYTSAVAYEVQKPTIEPWEANVTAMFDPNNLKWKDLIEPGTPLPTPWEKDAFDKHGYQIQEERVQIRANNQPEEVMEALFEKERQFETNLFNNTKYAKQVGAFEGADYNQFGMYRSQADCIMFTRDKNDFCKVCQRALSNVIDQYAK